MQQAAAGDERAVSACHSGMKVDKRRRRAGRRSIVGGNPTERALSASRLAEMGVLRAVGRPRASAWPPPFQTAASGPGARIGVPWATPNVRRGWPWVLAMYRHLGRRGAASSPPWPSARDGRHRRSATRDAVLRRRGWGRSIVYHYYRAGPRICAVLEASPALLGCMRWLLGQAARLWRWWSREAGR